MNSYWPDDADGDAMMRLEASGFDFKTSCNIDFNVDLDSWPPSPDFLEQLKARYPQVEVQEPEEDSDGYVLVVVEAKLSYELVMSVQESITALASAYGGVCETWAVLH